MHNLNPNGVLLGIFIFLYGSGNNFLLLIIKLKPFKTFIIELDLNQK